MRKNTLGSLIWLRMMRFTHESNLLSNEFLKQFDLTSAQFDVLVQIEAHGPLTQGELAKRSTVTQGGMSRMLGRMEKEGLIERKQEWKTKTISLTEKGKAKLDDAFGAQLAFQSSFFENVLTKDEQKQMLSYMSRIQKGSREMMQQK